MGLRTPSEYVESLRDGREIWYRGERVDDVTTHPTISKAVKHACIDYEMAESDEYRELSTYEEDGETYSAYYRVPRSAEDLHQRSKLIEAATAEGDTLVVLIKEIGTDALFALLAVTAEFEDQTYSRARQGVLRALPRQRPRACGRPDRRQRRSRQAALGAVGS